MSNINNSNIHLSSVIDFFALLIELSMRLLHSTSSWISTSFLCQVAMINRVDFICLQKTPFASSTANSELGEIYREWKEAPPLQTFNDMPPLVDQVPDLTQQLENYESDMRTYEDVLQSLCQSPNNN